MAKIKVLGMSCDHCLASVTKALEGIGLASVKVFLDSSSAEFQNNGDVTDQQIKNAIEEIGFEVG